jgi:hypothetical protein
MRRRSACTCIRDPLSFAKASQRRRFSSWGMFEWLAVWEKYTLAALQACAGVPSVIVRHDELVRNPAAAIARLRADLAAFGVRTDAPMSDAELRAWVPRPDAWTDRFFNEFQIVSESQTSLATALASGAAARWGLASTAAAREFASRRRRAAGGARDSVGQRRDARLATRRAADAAAARGAAARGDSVGRRPVAGHCGGVRQQRVCRDGEELSSAISARCSSTTCCLRSTRSCAARCAC